MRKTPVPVLPVLSSRGWHLLHNDTKFRMVTPMSGSLRVSSGTAAIALALEECGVTFGDEILVSAFNCRSMREAIWLHGAADVLYSVNADLTPDTDDIVRRITKMTRAILVPHFFGFPQDLGAIRQICDTHGIKLIEDCAHLLICSCDDRRIGQVGDYIVGSATKFFPVDDGGFLVAGKNGVNLTLDRKSIRRDLKSLWNAFEVAVGYGRFPMIGFFLRPIYALRKGLKSRTASFSMNKSGSAISIEVNVRASGYHQPMTRTAWATLRHYSLDSAARLRRRNFLTLTQACKQLKNARPLYSNLEDHIVPYMFPLIVDNPESTFRILKENGLPMYRWEDCGPSDCRVSTEYSRSLIQIPCHEQLRDDEVQFIIDTLLLSVG